VTFQKSTLTKNKLSLAMDGYFLMPAGGLTFFHEPKKVSKKGPGCILNCGKTHGSGPDHIPRPA
jgi:hypothetical protein